MQKNDEFVSQLKSKFEELKGKENDDTAIKSDLETLKPKAKEINDIISHVKKLNNNDLEDLLKVLDKDNKY